jgi:hypothetical protein
MFIDDIKLIDVFLEGLKVLGMFFLILTLIDAGDRYPSLAGKRWNMIISGFILMLIGFAFDWSDEFINYEASPVLNNLEVFMEEMGLIGGLFLVTFGFKRWFNFIGRFLGLTPNTKK